MGNKIVISPYAARLRSGRINAKNFPVRFWVQVIAKLNAAGFTITQIGLTGEDRIEGVSEFLRGLSLEELKTVLSDAVTFISVDSFLPHFCHLHQLKSGVVIWALSDPRIWSHPQNTNLLKDYKYLRPLQYQDWNEVEYNEAAFVLPQVVVDAVLAHVSQNSQSTNGRRLVPRYSSSQSESTAGL